MLKQPNRTREKRVTIRMTAHERELLTSLMEKAGATNMNDFIITRTLLGKYYNVKLDELSEICRLMSITANNVNQIAARLNEGGGVFASDMEEITRRQTKLAELLSEVSQTLMKKFKA
jgi:DNA-binding Xre family transcriptional regulator